MRFTKMHGAGNDFIILNDLERLLDDSVLPAIATRLCTRRPATGAAGMMVVRPAKDGGDFSMLFFNADGSMGEMCGNGARCIARYGYENGLSGDTQKVETTAGLVTGERIDQRRYRIRLNDPSVCDLHRTVTIGERVFDCGYMELGSPGLPHAIVVWDDFDKIDENELREIGRKLRFAPAFPKGANVTFCRMTGENSVLARTFERGVEDFTLACGTGCGCTASILCLRALAGQTELSIQMPGGLLSVSLQKGGEHGTHDIFLTGPTDIVAQGDVCDEDLVY